jgi:hypothetical protein
MTEIEMARECYIKCFIQDTPQDIIDVTRSGYVDGQAAIQSALAMYAMRQPEIDGLRADVAELVDALTGLVSDMRAMNIAGGGLEYFDQLIAKHGEPK